MNHSDSIDNMRAKLAARLGDGAQLIVDESHRRIYARDLADLPSLIERALFRTLPSLVIQPRNADDIARLMQFANEQRVPVFPRGVASSAYGGPVPTTQGIVIDLSPLQKIDAPDVNEKTITVDAGARWGDVEDALSHFDLQLFTYPSNRFATVAGWLAGGGFGLNGIQYGHVSKYVAALELVTPQGEIKIVRDSDADFDKYFATEGLMGIITRVTLCVREKSKRATRHLLYFESEEETFDFVQAMLVSGVLPTSVEFFDAHAQHLLNELAHASAQLLEKPALLIFIDNAEAENQFAEFLREQSTSQSITESPAHIAGRLWADRFFPMKIRRLGPSLLAGEVVLPVDKVASFLTRARALAQNFGLELATECHVLSTADGFRVLAMPMFLTDASRVSYSLHLAFASLLDRVGEKFGGQPYNLGIWHAPFVAERFGKKRERELREFKRTQDPRNILNPHKFFRVESRFLGLPGLLFHPLIFKLGMDVLAAFSFLLPRLIRTPTETTRQRAPSFVDVAKPQFETGVPAGYDLRALALTAATCTNCGECVSVCPAYLHTKDERVTGRGKMWLARQLVSGAPISKAAADVAWQCLRCRACAEICQAQLPLMAAYAKLEEDLEHRFGRPDALINEFVAGVERDPEYRAHVGLSLPIELMEQRWQDLVKNQIQATSHPVATNHSAVLEPVSITVLPEPAHTHGGKYHITTQPALPRLPILGKFAIDRSEQCISCGHCIEACVYSVHSRNPLDVRRMNTPKGELCHSCFRCVQECPRGALTISFDNDYARAGRGIFTGDVVSSLQRQSDEGKIPVLGAGYRGAFSGPGFDAMWTDMSEIVRPTRDGIHGREYISTAVDLGKRPDHLELGNRLPVRLPYLEIPLPILFNELPIHRSRPVLLAIARAARQLGTFAIISRKDWFDGLGPYRRHIALAVAANDLDEFVAQFKLIEIADLGILPRVKRLAPDALVMVRVDHRSLDLEKVCGLTRTGAEIIHLAFDPVDPEAMLQILPQIHKRLVDQGERDKITIIASGAIAMAEHAPKTIILGADAVAIDLPIVVALECVLSDQCFSGGKCAREIENIDPAWGEQRLVNLMASWRNQMLEVLGAMGMREVRRLRGERGRALFKTDLERKLFAPIFAREQVGK